MFTSILKTYYQRSTTILTPGQIEEIRHLKNKHSQQNGNHFFEELRKAQSISSENGSEVHTKQPCEVSNKSTPKEVSEVVKDPLGLSPADINMKEKQKKKNKLLKSESILNSNLPKILARGFFQNSLLDVSYELITLIKKDHIESEEFICKSEKLFALNSLH
ncbi:15831_t:CDS:2 [Cetraspora pellucida]|uniref:15831_t:CDS:1 n=1 Tax=Cetraspora pellucida TaxID=1433469 RepID=A0A9N8VH55_9GLOM|nr:15831_t:CDS:2 [Cetraspora pellucida]